MKGNIVYFWRGMYCEKKFIPFFINISSNRMSWKLVARFHPINCFLLSLFLWSQADKPARPISWLGLCERIYCLPCREKESWKIFKPFLRNISSNKMSYKLMTRFCPINCFHLSLFLWTPGWQTSAAYWLTRFMWKEILFTLPRERVMKKLRAVLEK